MSTRGPRLALLAGDFALYLEGGGHWSWFLQYVLGLRELGVAFDWLEYVPPDRVADLDPARLDAFHRRLARYGLADLCRLVTMVDGRLTDEMGGGVNRGSGGKSIRAIVADADAVWCVSDSGTPDIVRQFRRSVLLDVDPGHLQVAALQTGESIDHYDVYATVGQNVGEAGCEVPTLGKTWHRYAPVVHMASWPMRSAPARDACLSSVTHWTWETLQFGDRELSVSKRDAYLRYLDLPARTKRCFELAAPIRDVPDAPDRALLQSHGWRVVDPAQSVGSVDAYQAYIARSFAEICCVKPIFRELHTGWISERSAAYLASGRPVLMERTGVERSLPSKCGLLYFDDIEEAAEGVRRIEVDYATHAAAAREIAESFFSSSRVLPRLLDITFGSDASRGSS